MALRGKPPSPRPAPLGDAPARGRPGDSPHGGRPARPGGLRSRFATPSATGIPEALSGLGLDPGASIADAGLDPRIFEDPRNELPIASLGRLLRLVVARSGCPHVGLLVGCGSGLASLGPVGLLARHSPDVGTALRNLIAHAHLRDRGGVLEFRVSEGLASLGYEIYQPDVEASDQICDGAMAIARNVMQVLCNREWRPSAVLFAHRAPGDTSPFRRVFQARLHFDADRTALVFPARWLRQPTDGADPALFLELASQIEALETRLVRDLVVELRRMLRLMLLTERGSVDAVAGRMGMRRRTLNRRLAERGTSLQLLVDTTRCQIARQLVENTGTPLTEIAATLGYADLSAFTRAFRRWTGRPPSTWRRGSLPGLDAK